MPAAVLPTYEREQVLVGQAALRLFPLTAGGSAPALPADTVDINGVWPVGWTHIGATEEGVTLKFSRSTEDLRIEESQVAIDKRTTELTFSVDTTLAQDSLKQMRLAFGGGTIVTTPATSSQPAISQLTVSPELDRFALGLEGRNEFGYARRILIPIVQSVADAEAQYRRAAAYRKWNVSFASLIDIEQCVIRDVTAPKLP